MAVIEWNADFVVTRWAGEAERMFAHPEALEHVEHALELWAQVSDAAELCGLRQIDLMIWTAVTAVLLKYYLAMIVDDFASHYSVALFWVERVSQCVFAIVSASTLVGSGILIRARCYTMFKRLQPGHWLVLIASLGCILQLIAWPFYDLFEAIGVNTNWVCFVSIAIISTLKFAAFVFAIMQLRDAKRWRVLMGAAALDEGADAALAGVSVVIAICSNSRAWVITTPPRFSMKARMTLSTPLTDARSPGFLSEGA